MIVYGRYLSRSLAEFINEYNAFQYSSTFDILSNDTLSDSMFIFYARKI